MTSALVNKPRSSSLNAMDEFYSIIAALLENDQVQQLDNFIQHRCFTRLQHSLDVAYLSFRVTKLFGLDSKSAARAGLLHDLFLYDRKSADCNVKSHWRSHPLVALTNARKICELNAIEEDIIKKHMWLVTLMPPRYRESYIVTFVDKYCAVREFIISVFSRGTPKKRKNHHTDISKAA